MSTRYCGVCGRRGTRGTLMSHYRRHHGGRDGNPDKPQLDRRRTGGYEEDPQAAEERRSRSGDSDRPNAIDGGDDEPSWRSTVRRESADHRERDKAVKERWSGDVDGASEAHDSHGLTATESTQSAHERKEALKRAPARRAIASRDSKLAAKRRISELESEIEELSQRGGSAYTRSAIDAREDEIAQLRDEHRIEG